MNKEDLITIKDYNISPDDIPMQFSKNTLREFIIDILKEKGLLKECIND